MNRLPSWCLGLTTLLVLTVACLWNYYPPIAGPQHFGITFPSPLPVGTSEPVVVTGKPTAGDFLYVRYVDAQTVVFTYDSWGHGGPSSRPIAIKPGTRHTLELAMPSLAAVPGSVERFTENVRLTLDGIAVLEGVVHSFQRHAEHAYFGRNPLGGTSCGAQFQGQLTQGDGRPVATNVPAAFTLRARIRGWLWHGRWQVGAIALVSLAVAWAARHRRLTATASAQRLVPRVQAVLTSHRAFALTAVLCCTAFAAMITHGTFRLISVESFTDFYDFQASSLLQGRLDVPEAAVMEEAFIHEGKTYGYFGLTPALLRLPFVIFGRPFGELSRAAMLVYFAVTLVGAYRLLLDATRLLRPSRPPITRATGDRPATWQTVLFTVHVGLGSTVFFLGSRAYIYHEAILCGIMFAVLSCWCALRHLANPTGRWWLGALALGVLSVHARPPTGLFALTVLGCVAATHLFRLSLSQSPSPSPVPCPPSPVLRPPSSLRPLAIGALAIAGVASFNALSYAKFGTIEGCPLRLNVQYDAKRLANIDSRQFHLANLPYGLATYVLRSTVEFEANFPWIYLGPKIPRADFPRARLDLPDRTLAVPFGMTGLFVLATAVGAWACWTLPAARAPLLVLSVAVVPVALAMFAAIATAERYTGDFCPYLISAAAFALAAPVWHRTGVALLVGATLWSCALTFAVTLHYQGQTVWGLAPEVRENYQQLRDRVDRFLLGSAPTSR